MKGASLAGHGRTALAAARGALWWGRGEREAIRSIMK